MRAREDSSNILILTLLGLVAVVIGYDIARYAPGSTTSAQQVSAERAREIFTTVLPGDILVLNPNAENRTMIVHRDSDDKLILGDLFTTPPSIGRTERFLMKYEEIVIIRMDDPEYNVRLQHEVRRRFNEVRTKVPDVRGRKPVERLPI